MESKKTPNESRWRPALASCVRSLHPVLFSLTLLQAIVPADAQSRARWERVERLKADVFYLASDALEGRGISTSGIDLAARHVHAEFKRLGLKSGTPDGGYYQPFEYKRDAKSAALTLRNVIGVLEGKGEKANETIVVGAHYDHLGFGEVNSLAPEALRGRIHPGADDNASGVSAMLELARRFVGRTTAPPPAHGLHRVLCGRKRPDRKPALCGERTPLSDQEHSGDDQFRHGGSASR